MGRLLTILIQIDCLVMAIFGGKRNETLSSAAWSLEQDGKLLGRIFRPVIDGLFHFFQPDHCSACWLEENQ